MKWTHWNLKNENKVRKCSFVPPNFKDGFWQGIDDMMCIKIHGSQYNTDITKINIAIYCTALVISTDQHWPTSVPPDLQLLLCASLTVDCVFFQRWTWRTGSGSTEDKQENLVSSKSCETKKALTACRYQEETSFVQKKNFLNWVISGDRCEVFF